MDGERTRGARPLYRDIAERTQGDLYIGVVGPVRTGKSTFIAGFMQQLVLPLIPPGAKRDRLQDELPQGGAGRTITTTQPVFIPGEGAAHITLSDNAQARVRMVDSVGYPVRGAIGTREGEHARMVSTPWSNEDMPFEEAAELGTRKVMRDHATIGVVVTADGSFGELARSAFTQSEEAIVSELKALGKPFVVVLNTARSGDEDTSALRANLEQAYGVPVLAMDVKAMTMQDIKTLLETVLMEFPLRVMHYTPPAWLDALDDTHWLVEQTIDGIRRQCAGRRCMRDGAASVFAGEGGQMTATALSMQLGEGMAEYQLTPRDGLFNQILSEQCGADISGDAHLLSLLKELVRKKEAYDRIAGALEAVKSTGYGLVTPDMTQIALQEPQLMRQGTRYGVRLRATAPTLHLIRSDIDTEIAPVLGTQAQSEEFVQYLKEAFAQDENSLWDINFFGKSLRELVREGFAGKMTRMPPDTQEKIQQALTRMLNESEGGMICIVL